MKPRWLVYTSAGILIASGVAYFIAAATEWGDRATMVDPIPAEAAEQAGFVLEICAMGALNLVAALTFVLVRRQMIWWLVVGLQGAIILIALVEAAFTDPPGWIAFSTLPLATLLLLVGARFVPAKLTPSAGSSVAARQDFQS